ncbi:helix-turn-helix domain-containing protein [Nocardia sp. SYP-A9097]|uniref:helix-turn-helix domain-containing protein n=1 Tax=Nocardia sp. SYP-A9097 TaxID=2663237 RepID=UPI00129BF008|nr:helix-turn-helix domain-containing protein [Nocardia sp. SYP-A9097]MRH92319.1 helix-turn-helix domain-containing protein [Nocardia sp. SYP-A9097]
MCLRRDWCWQDVEIRSHAQKLGIDLDEDVGAASIAVQRLLRHDTADPHEHRCTGEWITGPAKAALFRPVDRGGLQMPGTRLTDRSMGASSPPTPTRPESGPFGEVAAQYGVTRQSVTTWRKRYEQLGVDGLKEFSRRPHRSPRRLNAETEALICELRRTHRRWGARRISYELGRREVEPVPSHATVRPTMPNMHAQASRPAPHAQGSIPVQIPYAGPPGAAHREQRRPRHRTSVRVENSVLPLSADKRCGPPEA